MPNRYLSDFGDDDDLFGDDDDLEGDHMLALMGAPGFGDDDDIGARANLLTRRKAVKKKLARRMLASAALHGGGAGHRHHMSQWERLELARGDMTPFGIDSGGAVLIPAAASATITTQPQKRVIPRRLVISDQMANVFAIGDIRIGVEPIFITTTPVTGAMFLANSNMPDFRAVLCEVSQQVSITVINVSGVPARFIGGFTGAHVPAQAAMGMYGHHAA